MSLTTSIRRAALGAACVAACGTLLAQGVAPLSRAQSRPPIKAQLILRTGDKDATTFSEVILIGRDGDVLLAQGAQSAARVIRIDKTQIVRCEFALDYDRAAVAAAEFKSDWGTAVRVLSPVARLTLPFLDAPDNNGLELALDLGTYMGFSADREMRNASTNSVARERALRQYEAAYDVFRAAAQAEWSPLAGVATLKGCHTLIAQGKIQEAEEALGALTEPDPADVTYGHYWLIQGELLRNAGKTREALDAVVKSTVFANKDVETFPAALLLSADCYAKLGQYHRARDIYYEVAVLFTGSDWSSDALNALAAVMAGKKTAAPEKAPIENVFFKVADDMNKLSEELLATRNPQKPRPRAAEAKKE